MGKIDYVKLALKGWSLADIKELKEMEGVEGDVNDDDAGVEGDVDDDDAGVEGDVDGEDTNNPKHDTIKDDVKNVVSDDTAKQVDYKALYEKSALEKTELEKKLKTAQQKNVNSSVNDTSVTDAISDLHKTLKDIF